MIPVILLTAVSNSMVAVSFGLFFDLVLALTVGGSFYALAAYMMLTMLAAVLAQALKEKKYRMGVYQRKKCRNIRCFMPLEQHS